MRVGIKDHFIERQTRIRAQSERCLVDEQHIDRAAVSGFNDIALINGIARTQQHPGPIDPNGVSIANKARDLTNGLSRFQTGRLSVLTDGFRRCEGRHQFSGKTAAIRCCQNRRRFRQEIVFYQNDPAIRGNQKQVVALLDKLGIRRGGIVWQQDFRVTGRR